MAIVILGGLASSALLNLAVLPVLAGASPGSGPRPRALPDRLLWQGAPTSPVFASGPLTLSRCGRCSCSR